MFGPAVPEWIQAINTENATLAPLYEGALAALEACAAVDECAEWPDRMEALASYAKQSKNDNLRKMAYRIQARAIRRGGLLKTQLELAETGKAVLAELVTRWTNRMVCFDAKFQFADDTRKAVDFAKMPAN